jgi:hypothetical protein
MATIKKTIKKAQDGKSLSPDYRNIKGKGWDSFKTPTAKDSADYREGFNTKLKGEGVKQYPSPSGAKVRGYNEASERTKPKAKNGKQMIKRADGSYSQRGLWDNIRAAKGSGKKPTAAMLKQEHKIKSKTKK